MRTVPACLQSQTALLPCTYTHATLLLYLFIAGFTVYCFFCAVLGYPTHTHTPPRYTHTHGIFHADFIYTHFTCASLLHCLRTPHPFDTGIAALHFPSRGSWRGHRRHGGHLAGAPVALKQAVCTHTFKRRMGCCACVTFYVVVCGLL